MNDTNGGADTGSRGGANGDVGGDDAAGEVAELRPADGAAPRAAILSVGSELLLGDLTDTNATWLSTKLKDLGVEVLHHLAVRDDLDEFVTSLHWLAERCHIVIIGGGLGPTADDLTREAAAAAAGVELEQRDDLERAITERFEAMGRPMSPHNLRQARVPAGARAFDPVGTAPGFALTLPGGDHPTRIYAVPGVPWELRELFLRDIAPEVQAIAGPRATLTRVVHVVGKGESNVAALVEPIVEGIDEVTLSFLARSSEVQVRLTVSAADPDAARAASQPVLDEVIAALGSAVAAIDDETLEDAVLRLLGATGTTVATAESATAGAIAARLGRVPGASLGLKGGVAVYATESKHDLLGIPQDLLDEPGPVSAEVTERLASAVRDRFDADWGVAVTGVAGPSTQNGTSIGTAFWALAHPDGSTEVHDRQLTGDRGQIIDRLGSAALDLLRRRLQER